MRFALIFLALWLGVGTILSLVAGWWGTMGSQWFASTARMQFSRPEVGNLTIESYLADSLWRVVGAQWPEHGVPPEASVGDLRRRIVPAFAFGVSALVHYLRERRLP